VTLDVWVDFRCTACEDFNVETLPQLIANYVRPAKLKIVYHDLLVIDSQDGTTESRDAADAALCAADQGKFWAYQDWLFANQSPTEKPGAFTLDRLTELAQRAGLDMTAFEPCLTSGKHNAEIVAESQLAPSSLIGVPSFFVNGTALGPGAGGGVSTYADVAAAIDAALPKTAASSAPPVAAGTFLVYTVSSKDKSLSGIAGKFGISLAQLELANPLSTFASHNYDIIYAGMTIYIPWQTWVPTPPVPSLTTSP